MRRSIRGSSERYSEILRSISSLFRSFYTMLFMSVRSRKSAKAHPNLTATRAIWGDGVGPPGALATSPGRFLSGQRLQLPAPRPHGLDHLLGRDVQDVAVRGVEAAGFPWVIREFEAKVKDNGNFKVEGKGLVLAGANGFGTRGRVRTVQATLFCGDPASATEHSSGAIILEPNGDFKVKDTLDNLPLPDPCARPVLLIRVVELAEPEELPPAKAWIAAGIPEDDDDDKDKDDD